MSELTGSCKFCGQIRYITAEDLQGAPVGVTDPAEHIATMRCDCQEARDYQRLETVKWESQRNINELFSVDYPHESRLMKDAVELMCYSNIRGLTIKLEGNTTAKLAKNNEGTIKIVKTKTSKESRES